MIVLQQSEYVKNSKVTDIKIVMKFKMEVQYATLVSASSELRDKPVKGKKPTFLSASAHREKKKKRFS